MLMDVAHGHEFGDEISETDRKKNKKGKDGEDQYESYHGYQPQYKPYQSNPYEPKPYKPYQPAPYEPVMTTYAPIGDGYGSNGYESDGYHENGYDSNPYGSNGYGDSDGYGEYEKSLTCYHCDAANFEQCYKIGKAKTCSGNAVCMIEVRKRKGKVSGVCMGCKNKDACLNQKSNNFPYDRRPWDCKPKAKLRPSVCRQCCDKDNCTKNFNPSTYKGWRDNLLGGHY